MAASIARKCAMRCKIAVDRAIKFRQTVKYVHTTRGLAFVNEKQKDAFRFSKKKYKNDYRLDQNATVHPSSIPDEHKFIDEEGNVMDATRSDEFGLLIPDDQIQKIVQEPDNPEEVGTEFVPESKLTEMRTNYPKLVQKLLAERKYQEAVDLVTVKMIKEEHIKPSAFAFNLLIGAFGRLGNTEIAFKLYIQMKERGLKPDVSTYTSLFNACANSEDKKEGLRRATYLREKLQEKGAVLNSTNYNSMIKAFGLCGDLWSAFEIGDEMIADGHTFTSETLNFLLMACASDREMGFSKALLLWREFGQKLRQPDVFSYNLLLRVTRDCSVGAGVMKAVGPGASDITFISRGSSTSETSLTTQTPTENQITPFENVETRLQTPEARLKVFGDSCGFLDHMKTNQIEPNLKTFALLMEIMESSREKEDELLEFMTQGKVKPDAAMFNVVLKKRVFRDDDEGVKIAFGRMQEMGVLPDIITFGTLAVGCRKRRACIEFLESMNSAGFRPNIQIMGALVKNMSYVQDWYYVSRLLQLMLDEQIDAEPRLLRQIDASIDRFKQRMANEERGRDSGKLTEQRKEDYRRFILFYRKWLNKAKMRSPPLLSRVEIKK